MRITDEVKYQISDQSYTNNRNGQKVYTDIGQFRVIEKRDNTPNGLRAYAFAPVVNTKHDPSHIVRVNTSLYRN